jgi:hypothetical protein
LTGSSVTYKEEYRQREGGQWFPCQIQLKYRGRAGRLVRLKKGPRRRRRTEKMNEGMKSSNVKK